MITFQSIIDEARKRKEQIAKNFYQTLQLGEEHDVFTWGLVIYFDNVLALFEEQLKSFEELLSSAEAKLTATKQI